MRSKILLVWYTAIFLLLLEAALLLCFGFVASFAQQRRWDAFNSSMKDWKPAGNVPYAQIIDRYAAQYKVSAELVAAVIEAESSFNPQAVSQSGAYGLMQVIPSTWILVNKEIPVCRGRHAGDCTTRCYFEPELNIHIGTAYLSQLQRRYNGNSVFAVAAYNAGPGAVDRYAGVPPFQETEEYVGRIIDHWQKRNLGRNEQSWTTFNWAAARRRVGGVMIATFIIATLAGCHLYQHYRSWRWR